jgi:hypothetical protein
MPKKQLPDLVGIPGIAKIATELFGRKVPVDTVYSWRRRDQLPLPDAEVDGKAIWIKDSIEAHLKKGMRMELGR